MGILTGRQKLIPCYRLAYVMSKYVSPLLLFTAVALAAITTTTTTATANNVSHLSSINFSSPGPSPTIQPQSPIPHPPILPPPPPPAVSIRSPPPPPPSRPEYMQQQQLKNIIDALIGAGDFAAWANILFNPKTNSSIPTTTTAAQIPTTATMFVPGNDALSHLSATATGAYNFDPFIIPYHILPQRLTFSELQLFKIQTRLPTLLPSKTIIITNNTASNFTIDDSSIIQPDIYQNPAVCVHGIATILDYRSYGDAAPAPPTSLPPPPLPPSLPDETVIPLPEDVRNCSSLCVVSGGDFLILLFLIFASFTSIFN